MSKQRDADMLTMHLVEGKSQAEIARHYNISEARVSAIAKANDWHKQKAKFVQLVHDRITKVGAKQIATSALSSLKLWSDRILGKLKDNKEVTIEEIRETIKIAALFLNENRLTDEKPTQITSGVVEHRVIVPAGTKRWGLDPPGPNVKQIESAPVNPDAKPDVDLDAMVELLDKDD